MTDQSDQQPPPLFDSAALEAQRRRAEPALKDHDFLIREVADRLTDRLTDIDRVFDQAVDLSPWPDYVANAITSNKRPKSIQAIGATNEILDVTPASADLIISNFGLHTLNDLPGILIQIRRALKPDGLFLAAFPGGETLHELRHALIEGESRASGGMAPRVAPFVDLADAAALLQRAGFSLPVADADRISVTYADMFALMRDLRGMGEANILTDRPRNITGRTVFLEAANAYQSLYGQDDGRIPATFEILFMAGWAPHESQQKPLAPGSAGSRLAAALDTDEVSTGDKAGK